MYGSKDKKVLKFRSVTRSPVSKQAVLASTVVPGSFQPGGLWPMPRRQPGFRTRSTPRTQLKETLLNPRKTVLQKR